MDNPEKRPRRNTKKIRFMPPPNTPFDWINGHLVTYSFAPERNDALTIRIKKLLAASYTEENIDCTFAESDSSAYHDGGNAGVP